MLNKGIHGGMNECMVRELLNSILGNVSIVNGF